MKKFVVSTLLGFAALTATAQNPYLSFSTFQGDTLAYLHYNYIENKAHYVGKTFEYLMNTFEMPVTYNQYDRTMLLNDPNPSAISVSAIYLYSRDEAIVNMGHLQYNRGEQLYWPFYSFKVSFQPPYYMPNSPHVNDDGSIERNYRNQVMKLKNAIVSNVELLWVE